MSRTSVVLSSGKEVAFGFDKYPYGYYIQVFNKPLVDDEDLQEADGLTKGQWFDAEGEFLDTEEKRELHEKAAGAIGSIALDLDINGKPFDGNLNIRPL